MKIEQITLLSLKIYIMQYLVANKKINVWRRFHIRFVVWKNAYIMKDFMYYTILLSSDEICDILLHCYSSKKEGGTDKLQFYSQNVLIEYVYIFKLTKDQAMYNVITIYAANLFR